MARMAQVVLDVALVVFSVYALLKFVFFFAVPYRTRRRALDKAYSGRTSATKTSDTVSVVVCICLVLLLLAAGGVSGSSFAAGLLVGMTLIQVYFHRFSTPVEPGRAPEPPISPIKVMSYAIQDRPARAARELTVMTLLLLWSLGMLATDLVS